MKRGRSAESPNVSRRRFTTAFNPCSKSTNVPVGQEALTQLLARDEIPGSLQQQRQDVEGLSRQAEAHAGLAELTGVEIQLEDAESDHAKNRP
jgi:hypothetical protein